MLRFLSLSLRRNQALNEMCTSPLVFFALRVFPLLFFVAWVLDAVKSFSLVPLLNLMANMRRKNHKVDFVLEPEGFIGHQPSAKYLEHCMLFQEALFFSFTIKQEMGGTPKHSLS